MTTLVAIGPNPRAPVADDVHGAPAADVQALVEVLVCGVPDRGDDGAPAAALVGIATELPSDVAIRFVGRLDIDDLLAIPSGAGAVVVDIASGVEPGWVVEIPFVGFASRASGIRGRSSDALSRPETVGLASMIRGRPLIGMIVAIGGVSFGPVDALSWPVASALSAFRLAIIDAIDRVRAQVLACAVATG